MTELKPCPFCGGTDLRKSSMKNGHDPRLFYWFCDDCGASGPKKAGMEGATREWNDRAILPEPEIVIPPMQPAGTIYVQFQEPTPMQPRKLDLEELGDVEE